MCGLVGAPLLVLSEAGLSYHSTQGLWRRTFFKVLPRACGLLRSECMIGVWACRSTAEAGTSHHGSQGLAGTPSLRVLLLARELRDRAKNMDITFAHI